VKENNRSYVSRVHRENFEISRKKGVETQNGSGAGGTLKGYPGTKKGGACVQLRVSRYVEKVRIKAQKKRHSRGRTRQPGDMKSLCNRIKKTNELATEDLYGE